MYHYIKSYWNLLFQFWIIYANLLDVLYKILLAIYFNDYNNITADKKVRIDKNVNLVIYFLMVINMINGTKKMKKKVNQSQKTLFLKD